MSDVLRSELGDEDDFGKIMMRLMKINKTDLVKSEVVGFGPPVPSVTFVVRYQK